MITAIILDSWHSVDYFLLLRASRGGRSSHPWYSSRSRRYDVKVSKEVSILGLVLPRLLSSITTRESRQNLLEVELKVEVPSLLTACATIPLDFCGSTIT